MKIRLIITILILFTVTACTSANTESTEKANTQVNEETNKSISSEVNEEHYSREMTEEEQKYIDLVLNEDYETLLSLTDSKSNELLEDYNNIAFAFKKQDEIEKLLLEGDEYTREQMLPLKYGSIIKSVESVKYIPPELGNSVNHLYRKSIEEKERYREKEKEIQEELIRARKELEEIQLENYNKIPKIGMTTEEVLNSSWGEPKEINKTTTAYGTSEQWVYYGYRYLYFDDGILTTIQE